MECSFKIGDTVERIKQSYGFMSPGDIGVIRDINHVGGGIYTIRFTNDEHGYDCIKFKLAKVDNWKEYMEKGE